MPPSVAPRSTALPGLPRRRLTAEEQLQALRQITALAEHRAKLSAQLTKATEAQASEGRDTLDRLKAQQQVLAQEIAAATSAGASGAAGGPGAATGQNHEEVTGRLRSLEDRLAALQEHWQQAQGRIETMLRRAEVLVDRTRQNLSSQLPPLAAPVVVPVAVPLPPGGSMGAGDCGESAAATAPATDAGEASSSPPAQPTDGHANNAPMVYTELLRQLHAKPDRAA